MTLQTFRKSKYKCQGCVRIGGISYFRHSYDYVKEEFSKHNYKLLSTNYVRSIDKLSVQCDKDHITEISFNDFSNSGVHCIICFGLAKKTIDFVRNEFMNRGYALLSTEYINNHEGYILWSNFSDDKGCSYPVFRTLSLFI